MSFLLKKKVSLPKHAELTGSLGHVDGRGGSIAGGRSGRIRASVTRDIELVGLGVENVDVGVVDGSQLPTLAIIDMARDPNGDLPGRGIHSVGKGLVVRGPVDKVPNVQAENAGIGVDGRPSGGNVTALGDHVGGGWRGEVDTLHERGQETGQGGQGQGLVSKHFGNKVAEIRASGVIFSIYKYTRRTRV